MTKKISSVKVNKKQVLEENFRKKGLPELLSEVNFSIDTSETPNKIMKKFISAVKRKFKPAFQSLNEKDKLTYFQEIAIHPMYHVHLEFLNKEKEDDGLYEYLQELVYGCQTGDKGKISDTQVVKVTTKTGDIETIGYSLLNAEMGKSYHRTRRGYPTKIKKYGYRLILDIPTLIAETIMFQSLIDFAEKNKDVVQYLFVKQNAGSSFFRRIPMSDDFQKDYIAVGRKYGLMREVLETKESIESQKDAFYVTKTHIGSERSPFDDYLMKLVIREFIEQSDYVRYKVNEELKERSEYAKAFETKKQIKKTHQEKMNDNVFLTRYGFVELDNEVDLRKFKIIEENFVELCETMFVPARKEYSFRIKKLGKHRAAGVFFKYYQTTIFDLNHPDAFVHELWHQIDAMMAEGLMEDYFSETLEFREVYEKYRELVTENVDKLPTGDAFKKVWNGNTKFNKMYYLKPTEVFARSGEIYTTISGIHNSLNQSREELEASPVFSFNEEYLELVKNFFDMCTERLKEKEKETLQKTKVKVTNTKRNNTIMVDFSKCEQLSLF